MISVEKWAGLATNASPYSLPPGAAVTQVNLQVISPGQLRVRPGLGAVAFAAHSGSGSAVRSAIRYPGAADAIIYQNASGSIRIARGPS
jgi:hypothetical protein